MIRHVVNILRNNKMDKIYFKFKRVPPYIFQSMSAAVFAASNLKKKRLYYSRFGFKMQMNSFLNVS